MCFQFRFKCRYTGTVMLRLSVMVPGREFQTRGATHAKLGRANVVRDQNTPHWFIAYNIISHHLPHPSCPCPHPSRSLLNHFHTGSTTLSLQAGVSLHQTSMCAASSKLNVCPLMSGGGLQFLHEAALASGVETGGSGGSMNRGPRTPEGPE